MSSIMRKVPGGNYVLDFEAPDTVTRLREERDHYRERVLELETTHGLAVLERMRLKVIGDLLSTATPDEYEAVRRFAAKVMGEGRDEYGPLNLDTDTRTAEDFREQQLDEQADADFYGIVAEMMEERADG